MNRDRWKIRILHCLIAVVLASVGAVGAAYISIWSSAMFFNYKYPHDGQNGLGALFVGLLTLPAAWILLFVFAMNLQRRWAWRRQEMERLDGAREHFTITGRKT
jgi:uncharacterized membrane protein